MFCFGKLKKKKSKKKKKGRSPTTAAEDDEAAPEPIDVLVDTIIGFMEKSTAYMRTVGNQVFSLISGEVKGSTIDLILTVNNTYTDIIAFAD